MEKGIPLLVDDNKAQIGTLKLYTKLDLSVFRIGIFTKLDDH